MSSAASPPSAAPSTPATRSHGPATSPTTLVQSSGLPVPLAALVLEVVRRTRLWRREQIEVARELVAHCLDGLESGADPATLARDFGEPRRAAALIAAAKKRSRPAWWRAWRMVSRAAGITLLILAVAYAILAARFFFTSPTVTRNYAAEFNARINASASTDLAWPGILDALREFGPLPAFEKSGNPDPARPGSPGWDQMTEFLDAHTHALQLLHRAAARPVLGYPYSNTLDPQYVRALQVINPAYPMPPDAAQHVENPMMVTVLLLHLGELRKLSRWLHMDARLAASRNDGERYLADLVALLDLADHALREPVLISGMVGIAIAALPSQDILDHAASPGLLTAPQLRALAHRLSAMGQGRIRFNPAGERMMAEDVIQRFYSDDGHGDGRFVGGHDPQQVAAEWGVQPPPLKSLVRAVQPVRSVMLPSRREINAMLDRFETAFNADDALPPWLHEQRRSDTIYNDIMHRAVYTLSPAFSLLDGNPQEARTLATAMAARDRVETLRAAALTLLALQAFHAAHGQYPPDLAALSPEFIPAIPLDPFDGRPLRYLPPAPGHPAPTLYSIGADARDDGGVPPSTNSGRRLCNDVRQLARFREINSLPPVQQGLLESARGDWVLWPTPPEPAPQ